MRSEEDAGLGCAYLLDEVGGRASRCGGERMDLIATEGAEDFYRSFPHRTLPGFRIYPSRRE